MSLIAYIDPGTGALIVQVVIAVVATIGIVFRRVLLSPFYALRRLFGGGSKETSEEK